MTSDRAVEIMRKVFYSKLRLMPDMENSKEALQVGIMIGQMERQLEAELANEIELVKRGGER